MLLAVIGTVAAHRLVVGQPSRRVYHIGFLGASTATAWAGPLAAFRAGLRDAGLDENVDIAIDYRWAEEDPQRLPLLARELVASKPDLIVTHGTPASRALRDATRSIPIVMAAVGEPERSGLVSSLSKPGGNLTGLSIVESDLNVKRLELLKQIAPSVASVAYLYWKGNPTPMRDFTDVIQSLGLSIVAAGIGRPATIPALFAELAGRQVDAILVRIDTPLVTHFAEIVQHANRRRWPSVSGVREFVDVGGLASYGVDSDDIYRRAAGYVARILRGAKPADLPIQQPTKYVLSVNRRTGQQIGFPIPRSVEMLADAIVT